MPLLVVAVGVLFESGLLELQCLAILGNRTHLEVRESVKSLCLDFDSHLEVHDIRRSSEVRRSLILRNAATLAGSQAVGSGHVPGGSRS
jgi:hypothetical protein